MYGDYPNGESHQPFPTTAPPFPSPSQATVHDEDTSHVSGRPYEHNSGGNMHRWSSSSWQAVYEHTQSEASHAGPFTYMTTKAAPHAQPTPCVPGMYRRQSPAMYSRQDRAMPLRNESSLNVPTRPPAMPTPSLPMPGRLVGFTETGYAEQQGMFIQAQMPPYHQPQGGSVWHHSETNDLQAPTPRPFRLPTPDYRPDTPLLHAQPPFLPITSPSRMQSAAFTARIPFPLATVSIRVPPSSQSPDIALQSRSSPSSLTPSPQTSPSLSSPSSSLSSPSGHVFLPATAAECAPPFTESPISSFFAPPAQSPAGLGTVNMTSLAMRSESTYPMSSSFNLSSPGRWGPPNEFSPGSGTPEVPGSRGLTLSKPVTPTSPIPGDPARCTGKKKALLIGIDYHGTELSKLYGAVADARKIKCLLIDHYKFSEDSIVVLTDDVRDPDRLPTRANIISKIQWLVHDVRKDDSLFFLFSGHGWQERDVDGDEQDGWDEVIVPVDYQSDGTIVDDKLHELMVKCLPEGCQLVALIDACKSGSALDLPFSYDTKGRLKPPEVTEAHLQRKTAPADVIMWSGCKDTESAGDADDGGAMVSAFRWAVLPNDSQSLLQILVRIREKLKKDRYKQKPQLSCSHDRIDVNTLFVM